MDTTIKAWKRTLREKVYIAKLAVFIGIPKMYTTHCPRSFWAPGLGLKPGDGFDELAPQGVVLSESKTPFSLANCSRVMGINDPAVHC